jgi:hypothetical protein
MGDEMQQAVRIRIPASLTPGQCKKLIKSYFNMIGSGVRKLSQAALHTMLLALLFIGSESSAQSITHERTSNVGQQFDGRRVNELRIGPDITEFSSYRLPNRIGESIELLGTIPVASEPMSGQRSKGKRNPGPSGLCPMGVSPDGETINIDTQSFLIIQFSPFFWGLSLVLLLRLFRK